MCNCGKRAQYSPPREITQLPEPAPAPAPERATERNQSQAQPVPSR